MQKSILLFLITILLTIVVSGAVYAENGTGDNIGNGTVDQIDQNSTVNDSQLSSNQTTSSGSSTNQTYPDPRIEHNGVINPTVYTTIQAAINAAQAGDTIWLEDGGVFTTTNNYLNPALVYVTKNLTFKVFNGGTATIDGSNLFRCIYIKEGVTATFYNITITRGRSLNTLLYDGAGIFNDKGTLHLYNCTLDNNDGLWSGGAIYNNQGTVTIENSTIKNNDVPTRGGAIYNNQGTVSIVQTFINSNSARNGGALFNNNGTITIENSTISGNTASGTGANYGGAVYNDHGILYIYGTNLLNNQASDNGGAVYATTGTTNILNYNRIIGNSNRVLYREGTSNPINAQLNWWGSNTGPTSAMYQNTDVSPYMVLTFNPVGPTNLNNTRNCTVTAELFRDSNGGDHSGAAYHVPDGPVGFSILAPAWGSLSDVDTVMTNAVANATFNADGGTKPANPVVVQAMVDNVPITTTFNILPAAHVEVTKTADNPNPNYGTSVNFTITAHNVGPDNATGVQITDILPAGLTFLYADNPDYNSTTGIWNIGILISGMDAVLKITVNVTQTGYITNWANVTAQSTYDYLPWCNNSTTIYVPQADVMMNKTGNGPLNVGQTGIFTITLHNYGPDTAHNVVVTDLIPAGFTAGIPSKGNVIGGVWTVGDLLNGEEATLNITGLITADMAGKNVTNNVTETQDEYTQYPQTATADIYIKKSELYVNVTPTHIKTFIGNTVTITYKVGNKGPDTAENVVMTLVIPEGLEFILANVDVGTYTYDLATRTLTWNLGNVPVGDPYLSLKVKVLRAGTFVIDSQITSDTSTGQPVVISAVTIESSKSTHGKTVPMQKTGFPLVGLIFAVLLLGVGWAMPKRK